MYYRLPGARLKKLILPRLQDCNTKPISRKAQHFPGSTAENTKIKLGLN